MTKQTKRSATRGECADQEIIRGYGGNYSSRYKKSSFCRATHRTREVGRLVDYRFKDGIPACVDDAENNYIFVIAQSYFAAAAGDEGNAMLDLLKWTSVRANWIKEPEVLALKLIKKMHPSARMMSDAKAGEMLRLKLCERVALKITTMSPSDCSKEEFDLYRKVRKRRMDKERLEFKRRRANAVPIAKIKAGSISAAKPWLAQGISRRTWYNRRKKEAEKLAENANCTIASHGLKSVAETRCTTASRTSNRLYNTQNLSIDAKHESDAPVQLLSRRDALIAQYDHVIELLSKPRVGASPSDAALESEADDE